MTRAGLPAASGQGGGGAPTTASGSGGAVLDDTARRAYQTRVGELDAELAEAGEWNDPERLARAEAEIDALPEPLAGAYGLGGRARTMADPIERVRKAVINRIRDSLDRIAQEHRALRRHLTKAVHTGTFCSYTPERPPVRSSDRHVARLRAVTVITLASARPSSRLPREAPDEAPRTGRRPCDTSLRRSSDSTCHTTSSPLAIAPPPKGEPGCCAASAGSTVSPNCG